MSKEDINALKGAFTTQGRIIPEGEKAPEGLQRRDLKIILGSVVSFDQRRQEITVRRFHGEGNDLNIPLTQPFAGTNSYIAGVPDIGSIVVLADIRGDYYPITYLPAYQLALQSKHVKKWNDNIKSAGKNDFFFSFKRMQPGEVALRSAKGPEIYLDTNLKLEDGLGDEILIRNYDNSIINTSVNNHFFAGGVWRNSGIAYRNSLSGSNQSEGQYAVKEVAPDGRIQFPLVSNNKEGLARKYYSEYLLEAEEETQRITPWNNVNNILNKKNRKVNALLSLGNFVGNNPSKADTYGKLLGVQLFKSPDDVGGVFNLTSVSGEAAGLYGLAITLMKPSDRNYNLGSMIGIDKEGHFYQYVQSASGGGLGPGRSISILADGSKKEQFGQEGSFGNSWDLTTQGGIRWIVGNHSASDNRYKEKSIDIRSTKGIFTYYGAPPEDLQSQYDLYEWDDLQNEGKLVNDVSAYKKIEVVNGRQRTEVRGAKELTASAGVYNEIVGLKEERISASNNTTVGADKNTHVENMYTLVVGSQKLETFGSRSTTITKGSNELVVDNKTGVGHITEEIKYLGNKEVTLKTGSIKEKITAVGSREFETKTGNFRAEIKLAGDITLKTKGGGIELSTSIGNVDVKTSGGSATFESAITTRVKGTKVELKGRVPLSGGVVTSKTHYDYITGSTLKGSTTVTATS